MAGGKRSKLGTGGSRVVSFRLCDEDFEVYWTKVRASGMSSSEFFRDCALTNRTQVLARPKGSVEATRVLQVVSKAGNNITQLAHRAKSEHAVGKIDARTYADILYQLGRISQYLKFTLAHVD
jgi:hypothetical protein